MVDRNDKRFFDFMCSCGDEGRAYCDRVYNEVKGKFGCEDVDFLTNAVYSLQSMKNGSAEIVGIPSDMWSAVSIEYVYNFRECDEDCGDEDCEYPDCSYAIHKFWIECDEIHHGLARAYQLVEEFDGSLG